MAIRFMRKFSPVLTAALLVILVSPISAAVQSSGSSVVIQYWYATGTNNVGGSQVWSYAATNLTMNATFSNNNGGKTEEITEFHIHTVAPGKDPYPSANGTNPNPFPQITAFYETTQIISNASECVHLNNSVGFICNVPHINWEHQV